MHKMKAQLELPTSLAGPPVGVSREPTVIKGAARSSEGWLARIFLALPRFLGRRIVDLVTRMFWRLSVERRKRLVAWMTARPRLVGAFYLLTGDYEREQCATFAGRFSHLFNADQNQGEEIRYSLRRSIHRIEKGLIMRPRRSVFAEDYVADAVQQFAAIATTDCGESGAEDPLIQWAGDVLHAFFALGGDSLRINRARTEFTATVARLKRTPGAIAPYLRDISPLAITCDAMLELAKRRRSVRWYRPESVPRELIDKAIDVARWSPSACNRQPFEFRIFDDPQLVKQVGDIPMGTVGFVDNFPCIVVLVGHLRAFPFERDRHLIYIDASLAAMAFEFALEVQGISSCSINWPDIPHREQKMRKLLGLKPDERPIMLISLGYPDPMGMVPFSQKKPIEEIRRYNV